MRIGHWLSRIFHRQSVEAPTRTPTTPAPTTTPRAPVDTFEPSAPMRVALGRVSGYSPTEQQKLGQATQLMADVLNSREFRDAVLGAKFAGRPGFASEARSPKEIYETIRAAKEHFTTAADGEVDLNVELRDLSWFQRKIVGYTTANSDTITTNRRFFASFEPAEIAGHLSHEWLHSLGFEHDFQATSQRPYSVPYELGELIESLAKGPLTPL